ncbi:phospholipid carrier-dependent glycosyltransferase [Flavobacterium arcticum]|uniref:Phospholipid carrier-dependent glycosyltransferase n=1 Tax=Flavobacterium arcticum TaxID=1784713 RepID=A0A345HEC4_9FLAO|nr:glycosyltransferase family 39 protein [Flavobacterium arcticum]AXG74934.1 phospholipid carrier-dependent glycosyltransferase [Flavobacterium arcticum]KAF2506487.1 phospholipid carrier-dependent glycosyltransferase [Flavobacterium arcticum]
MTFKNIKKSLTGRPITTIVLFGILVRLLLVALYWHVTIFPDSSDYIQLSEQLIKLDLTEHNGIRTLGYPLLLFLANNYFPTVVFIQFIIGIITSIYLYKIMLLLNFRKNIALIVTLIVSSFIHSLFYETNILTETLTLFFIALIFYTTLKIFFYKNTWKHLLILGFLLGYLVLIKPFYVFLPFLIYGLYTLKDFRFNRIINRTMIILVFPIIALLSCCYMNYINSGKFVSTSIYGFYSAQNCVYYAEKGPEEYSDIINVYVKHREEVIKNEEDVAMTIWSAKEEMHEKTGLNLIELSDRLNDYGKTTIIQNPLNYFKQVLLSWREFWKNSIYWSYESFNFKYANKACIAVWYLDSFILQIVKILFLLIIPYHLFLYIKNRKMTPEFIIVVFVFATSLMQALVTFGTNSRYSYPFEFLMVIALLLTFRPFIEKIIKQPLLKT